MVNMNTSHSINNSNCYYRSRYNRNKQSCYYRTKNIVNNVSKTSEKIKIKQYIQFRNATSLQDRAIALLETALQSSTIANLYTLANSHLPSSQKWKILFVEKTQAGFVAECDCLAKKIHISN